MNLSNIRRRAHQRQHRTATVWLEIGEWNGRRCYIIPERIRKLKYPE